MSLKKRLTLLDVFYALLFKFGSTMKLYCILPVSPTEKRSALTVFISIAVSYDLDGCYNYDANATSKTLEERIE